MTKHPSPAHQDQPCKIFSSKQNLKMSLSAKSTNCFWFFIDQFSCKMDGFAAFYERTIEEEYRKEYANLHLSEKDTVLHIGCGAYPLTALTLLRLYGVKKIVGIDRNQDMVRLAQAVVQEKHVEHKIEIEHSDGRNYPMEDFDVIIVSSCSWPTIEILEHVFHTAKKRSRIIVRELDHVVEPVLECIRSHHTIMLTEQMRHHPFPFVKPFGWQTFYLKKM